MVEILHMHDDTLEFLFVECLPKEFLFVECLPKEFLFVECLPKELTQIFPQPTSDLIVTLFC